MKPSPQEEEEVKKRGGTINKGWCVVTKQCWYVGVLDEMVETLSQPES